MIFLVVSFALFGLGMAGGSCPATKNDATAKHYEKALRFIAGLSGGKCRDMSKSCDKCSDKCGDPHYSHYMDTMCPRTCGLCQDDAGLLQAGTFCWKIHKGYEKSGSGVLKTVPFTNMYDCEKLCLKERECVGAAVTEFVYTSNKLCVLAKAGDLSDKRYYFGATKDCMKSSPSQPCQDYWDRCACCMSRMCNCNCPYYKALLGQVCRKTCGKCSEDENKKEDKNDDKNEDITWKKLTDVKLVGKVGTKGLSLEDAKEQHCPMCGGISCKKGKCNIMESVKKEKKKKGFTAYKPE